MESRQIELSTGARVFVATKGRGSELVVFLHAVGSDHTMWQQQMEALDGERYTLAAYDLRGHGGSKFDVENTMVRDAISISGFAKDTLALIDLLGFQRAHLAGISMGGAVALEVFRRRSDVVQSLTLANTAAFYPNGEADAAWLQQQIESKSMAESARELVPKMFGPGAPRELIDRAIEIEGQKSHHIYIASYNSLLQVDYRRMMEMIDVPVLLIGGTADIFTPTDPNLTTMQAAVPTAELVDIAGAGHYSNLDHPVEFTRALRAHLQRARSQGTSPFADTQPSEAALARAAKIIHGAQRPLVSVSTLGYYRGGPEALVQLAQRHAIPVIEQPRTYFNFPTRHPMHLGFDKEAFAQQADVVIEIHGDTISIGANTKLTGNPMLAIRGLASSLDKLRPDRDRVTGRFNAFASEHRRVMQAAQTRAITDAAKPEITKHFLSYCIGEAIDDRVVVYNDDGAEPQLIPRRVGDSWFEGMLKRGVSTSPDLTTVVIASDRAYSAAAPLAMHEARHPIVTIIANEGNVHFEKIVEAYGGVGIRVQLPRDLPQMLKRALTIAREQRMQVLLNVCLHSSSH
jgi:pimeloyl-ACP methyl ester carboxylesterase